VAAPGAYVTARTILLILVSVSLSATAQIAFKLGVSGGQAVGGESDVRAALRILFTPGVLGGLALYGVGTLLWLAVLSRVQVSQAYPFVGLSFVITAVLGRLVFHDDLGFARTGGILLIIAGIALVARS